MRRTFQQHNSMHLCGINKMEEIGNSKSLQDSYKAGKNISALAASSATLF
ncbi:MAG TPA: hypothetical protein VG738_08550 [Chitinophagaceae bacterium]|nr:hypothetical protein [Chitinophagaceae bacterium]